MIKPSEALAVASTIDPQLVDNATKVADYIDTENGHYVTFVLNVGATDTTVDAKLRQAKDSSGTSVKDITGYGATQLAATDDNKQVVFCVAASELDTANGFSFVTLSVTAGDGSTGAYISAVGLLSNLRYSEAADNDLSTVAEIID